jgi:hypothetical protein
VKAAGISALLLLVGWLTWWCVADYQSGEDAVFTAHVTGKRFVPESSTTNCYTDSNRHLQCNTTHHPAEYHVYTSERDGTVGDFNDAWAWSNLRDGDPCYIKCRIGGRSKRRWFARIESKRISKTNSDW